MVLEVSKNPTLNTKENLINFYNDKYEKSLQEGDLDKAFELSCKADEVNNKKYELIKNYKDAFNEEEFINKCTDYFYDYDYDFQKKITDIPNDIVLSHGWNQFPSPLTLAESFKIVGNVITNHEEELHINQLKQEFSGGLEYLYQSHDFSDVFEHIIK